MDDIIFLTSRFPFPLEKGDKLRAYYHIRYLSQYYNVHLIAINNKEISEQQNSALQQYCASIHVFRQSLIHSFFSMLTCLFSKKPFQVAFFYRPLVKRKIHDLIHKINPQHVHCHLIRTAEFAKDICSVSKSIDFMDAYSLGMHKRSVSDKNFLKRWFFKWEYKKLKYYENAMLKAFDRYAMISEQDCDAFQHTKKNDILIIPNGVDFSGFVPKDNVPKKYDIGFIGNLTYPPNIEAILFIAEQVIPLLKKEKPDIKLMIAGVNATSKILSLQSENIDVPGYFENISDALAQCRIILAPMIISIGLQNKILQAMAMKIPTIVTKAANNPIGAPDGEAILVADTPDEYKTAIIDLINNPDKAASIGENGFSFVKEHFDWDTQNKKLLKLIMT